MSNDFGKTLAEIFHDKYIIPLYQRNFAWRIEEIHQLLQDVHEARRNNPEGNYYIGSLVVLKRHNGAYEVIDGQQRLTVISMIAILLGQLSLPVLFYDSRPEVQKFFEMLCKQSDNPKEALHLSAPSLFYLKEACEFLRNAKAELPDGMSAPSKYLEDKGFAEYFMNRVILVRNEIPEDTDVAAYFEIMNNRGEQLQKHEIVKAQMMDNIVCLCADGTEGHDTTRQSQFSRIWNACARMDIPIHRLISSREREYYFGKEYDSFCMILLAPLAMLSEGEDGEKTIHYRIFLKRMLRRLLTKKKMLKKRPKRISTPMAQLSISRISSCMFCVCIAKSIA